MDNNMIEHYQATGCKKTRDELIFSVLPLVYKIARSLRGSSLVVQDLVQEGVLGVMRACDTYNPDKGTSFCSYATNTARFHMIKYLRSDNTIPRATKHAVIKDLGLSPVPLCHSEITALSASKGVSYEKALKYALLAIPSHVNIDKFTSDDNPALQAEKLEEYEILLEKLDKINTRDYNIFNARFAQDQTMTKIGQDNNLSSERINQIITCITKKLGG